MAGPGPSDATYAARAAISSGEKLTFFAAIWGPGCVAGIRPVPTWKSTAAAPTPARVGPSWLPSSVRTPSPFWPWQKEQPTRKSLRPCSTSSSSLWAESACDEGANAAYRLPVSTRPSMSRSSPATGRRRWRERRPAERFRKRTGVLMGRGSLDDVDRREQTDPHHVDEVPVVGDDDRAHRLLVGEAFGDIGPPEHEQERDETTGHVEAVEAGGQVEHRAVRRAGDGGVFLDQRGVLRHLARDEDRAHDIGEHEPLAQPPAARVVERAVAAHLAALGGEHTELAGHRRQHQDRGVDRGERDVELLGVLG